MPHDYLNMKLGNVIFYVKNLNASLEFYQKLGFKVSENIGKQARIKTIEDGVFITVAESDNGRCIPGKQACSFYVDNVGGLFEKYKLLGAPLLSSLSQTENGSCFAISDLDGSRLEFIQNR